MFRPHVLVCTTLTAFAMEQEETWNYWLRTAEQMATDSHHRVEFFVAIETDARGKAPFKPLISRMFDLAGNWWYYTMDDARTTVTSENRLRHIAMGQNLCAQFAADIYADWMLFMGSDCTPPTDIVPKLLEMKHPYVGAEVAAFCLRGPDVDTYSFPVQAHPVGGACLMLHKDIFTRVKFSPRPGLSEDYALARDVKDLFGIDGYTRKDIMCTHFPESVSPIENRHPGVDMKVYR